MARHRFRDDCSLSNFARALNFTGFDSFGKHALVAKFSFKLDRHAGIVFEKPDDGDELALARSGNYFESFEYQGERVGTEMTMNSRIDNACRSDVTRVNVIV